MCEMSVDGMSEYQEERDEVGQLTVPIGAAVVSRSEANRRL